jgi:regulator of MON1-CCZ1 complex
MPHIHLPKEVYVTQADMYTHVFVRIEERDPLSAKYTLSVITYYICSLNLYHITVMPYLHELLINALVSNGRWGQLHQFLQYHVVNDSAHVACQLLSLESKYPPAYQFAMDMMKRLMIDEQIVEVLISKNMILTAIRFMDTHNVKSITQRRILEPVKQFNDSTYHVNKFFEAQKPNGRP